MRMHLACGLLLLASGLFGSGCCLTGNGVCDAGVGCDSCATGGYETCGECQPGLCHHPWLWSHAKSALTCGAGCGDVYWGEWASDPPACGGPCDTCGTTECGGGCGYWNPLRGLAHLWGYRYAPAGYGMGYDVGYDEGCDSCAESYDTIMPAEESIMPAEEDVEEALPTPKPDSDPEPAKQASVKRSSRTVNPNRTANSSKTMNVSATTNPSRTVKHLPASHKTTTVRRNNVR